MASITKQMSAESSQAPDMIGMFPPRGFLPEAHKRREAAGR